jgi:GntR family transcriptional regulator/MocR family aminotransferase
MTFPTATALDSALEAPVYQQLYAQLRAAILSGKLKSLTKLTSTRALADELKISRNTVQSAYLHIIEDDYDNKRYGEVSWKRAMRKE